MSNSNGMSATTSGLARLIQETREKLAAMELTYKELTGAAFASAQRRAAQTFQEAVALDTERRLGGPPGPKISREDNARRKRQIVTYLANHPTARRSEIQSELARHGWPLSASYMLQLLNDMPEVQRIGGPIPTTIRYRLRPVPSATKTAPARTVKTATKTAPARTVKARKVKARTVKARKATSPRKLRPSERLHPERRPSAGFDGTTAEKARVIVSLVRDAEGGFLPLSELTTKARAAGVDNMTGMVNYIRKGWLKRTRDRRGENGYRFLQMPPPPPSESPAAPTPTDDAASDQ